MKVGDKTLFPAYSNDLPVISSNKERRMKYSRRIFSTLLLSLALVIAYTHQLPAMEVGDKAPDFELNSTKGGKLKLSDLKGKNVLINFYVLDFSPT